MISPFSIRMCLKNFRTWIRTNVIHVNTCMSHVIDQMNPSLVYENLILLKSSINLGQPYPISIAIHDSV